MAGNRRGKLKEELEGIHRNYDWIVAHCEKALRIIGDDNPVLTRGFQALAEHTKVMDRMAQEIYSTI